MSKSEISRARRQLLSGNFATSRQQGTSQPATSNPSYMRSPRNPAPVESLSRNTVTPPVSVIAYNRAAFGHRPGDLAAFNALGADDDERLTAWVDQQLNPDSIDDSDCDARIANGVFYTHEKSPAALWSEHWRNPDWPIVMRPGLEVITLKFVRAIHSKRQLKEVMADFWHDHFSVYWQDAPGQTMLMQYDRDVIRPNIFGNFSTLLNAVAKSPCMMFYLDQVYSTADGPNENYAREVMELHTFGSESYKGVIPSSAVEGYPDPKGYVEEDVFALAKALTGWSIRYQSWAPDIGDTGEFFTREVWHDTEEKVFMGQTIPAGQTALEEGDNILAFIATHTLTSTFIARKLCRRFVSDFPPESLVQSAAQVFRDHVDAPDQLGQVMRHILLSAEFRTTWGEKTRRPFHAVVSALRAGGTDFVVSTPDEHEPVSNGLFWLFGFTGHAPHEWHPPNGYPDFGPVWQSSSTLVMRWRVLNWIVDTKLADDSWLIDIIDTTWASPARTPNAIVDFWIERIFGYEIADTTRHNFVAFLAQGRNPALNLPIQTATPASDDYTTIHLLERIRAVVGLMFMSPEFQIK